MRARIGLVITGLVPAAGLIPSFFDVTGWERWQKWAVIVISILVSLGISYFEFYRPYLIIQEQYERAILDVVIQNLAYLLAELNPGLADFRFNIMKIRRRYGMAGARSLRIDYARGAYKPSELELEYNDGSGCCGMALANNAPVFFDRDSGDERHLNVPAIHSDVTSGIASILSVPVYRPKSTTPVAVLNVDSSKGVEHSKFDGETIQTAVIQAAALAGIVIREKGAATHAK